MTHRPLKNIQSGRKSLPMKKHTNYYQHKMLSPDTYIKATQYNLNILYLEITIKEKKNLNLEDNMSLSSFGGR